jgi:hypothetical protein
MFIVTEPVLREMKVAGHKDWYRQSPLRVIDDDSFEGLVPELQSCFDTLRDAFNGFEMFCIDAFAPDIGSEEAASLKKTYLKGIWTRLQCRRELTNTERPLSIKDAVEEAVLLAAKIHFRAVGLKIEHDDQRNTQDMKKLHAVTRKIPLGFWKTAIYVYLWM